MLSFIIAKYVWQILGKGIFLAPLYPWATPKKPILNRVTLLTLLDFFPLALPQLQSVILCTTSLCYISTYLSLHYLPPICNVCHKPENFGKLWETLFSSWEIEIILFQLTKSSRFPQKLHLGFWHWRSNIKTVQLMFHKLCTFQCILIKRIQSIKY